MTRIVGVERDGDALGVPLSSLQEAGVIVAGLGDTDLVVLWTPGTASSLDSFDIAAGTDVGATGVFEPIADGQALTFSADQDGSGQTFTDTQTGSVWNVLGQAIEGPLAGAQLEAVPHVDTFWFAWSAFQPESAIIE